MALLVSPALLYNAIKSFKKTFNSKYRVKLKFGSQRYRNTKTKTQEDENLVLPKVKNGDLYKSVVNKIMTTRE